MSWLDLHTTFMYKNSCGFVCEEFPKEIQTLQTRNDLWLSTKPQLFLYGVSKSYFQSILSVFNFSKIVFADFSANIAGPKELLELKVAFQTSFFDLVSIPTNS